MANGYFDDGATHIELGAHTVFVAGFGRNDLILAPHDAVGRVLDTGGGIVDVSVRGQRLRANMGDAEYYIYEILTCLARSEAGDIGSEDNRGERVVFGNSVCVGGAGNVHAYQFADIRMDFESPEKSSEAAWGSVPATAGIFAGSTTNQTYVAGGEDLGCGGSMRIEMERDWPLRVIPRARGARTSVPYRGAVMLFNVRTLWQADGDHITDDITDLVRAIGPRHVDLVANGMTYSDVLLRGAGMEGGDAKYAMVSFDFVQEVGACGL